ncbi:MAG: rhombosortase [Woeseia sp.]
MRRTAQWRVPLVIAAASVSAELGGSSSRAFLRFERTAIVDAEPWRLVTGHFVHLGPAHMLMNTAALLLLWLLVGQNLTAAGWLVVISACLIGIDLGFWLFDPQLTWYVGLSGLLHGMLAAGLVARYRVAMAESLTLGCLLAAKILFEQVAGPLPGSALSAGGPVVVNAHFYGALAGVAVGLLLRTGDQPAEPI